MPYISTDRVKEIRKQIRKEFPEFKFSIRNRHHSSISITILEGPIEMITGIGAWNKDDRYEPVNHFYIKDHYEDYPEIRDILLRIYEIANKGNYIESVDGDYGNIPSFYVNIDIGDWDKPYKIINK